MKRNLKYAIAIAAAFPMLMYTSCTEDKPMEEEVEVEIVTDETPQNEKFYQIPAPDEMFGFIRESGLTYNKALINSPQKQTSYTTPLEQTMIFGVYSADLAYTAAYEEFNESIKYFAIIQKMAENIGISGAFNEELMNNIKNNLDKPEQLLENSNDSYFSVVDYLEQNEQGDKLGIIAASGWLETVYIVANSIDYNKNEAALQRLADQKLTLDNLLMYLDKYNESTDVKEMTAMLKELEVVFEPVAEKDPNSSGITLKKKGEGKMVLGGGSSLKISKEQFEAIKSKVTELRTKIVK
ncbi:MAG TPA: hypothetical protein VIN73_12305 [Vicingaceae bacterium]